MSEFNYGGTDEESAEIKKLNVEVVSIASCEDHHILTIGLAERKSRRFRELGEARTSCGNSGRRPEQKFESTSNCDNSRCL